MNIEGNNIRYIVMVTIWHPAGWHYGMRVQARSQDFEGEVSAGTQYVSAHAHCICAHAHCLTHYDPSDYVYESL